MIYLDNAATTKQNFESTLIQNDFACNKFFNSSATYAVESAKDIEKSKKIILEKLFSPINSSLIFTGSATEANNLILNSFDNIVISAGEHASIFEKCNNMIQNGKNVKICPLTKNGQIDYISLENMLNEKTRLVSVFHVNSETGAINNLAKVKEIMTQKCPNALLHSDGVQAFTKIDVNLSNLGVDFYTISAHKIGGPKGIGALYCKNKNKIKPLIFGGEQEYALRAGTENLPTIMAFSYVVSSRVPDVNKIILLRKLMISELKDENIICNLNENCSPYILSLTFSGVNGETLINLLSSKEIYISRGSACSSKKSGNRIFEAMGMSVDQTKSLIRISFFEYNTPSEIITVAKELLSAYKYINDRVNSLKKGKQ